MALPQSAVSELLEAFRTGEGFDLVRESVRMLMQESIGAEATEQVGAARYERSESRATYSRTWRSRCHLDLVGVVPGARQFVGSEGFEPATF